MGGTNFETHCDTDDETKGLPLENWRERADLVDINRAARTDFLNIRVCAQRAVHTKEEHERRSDGM